MAAQSFLLQLGARLAVLGSAASLAIAAPADLAVPYAVTSHTAANRTGLYFTIGAGTESINLVTGGHDGSNFTKTGAYTILTVDGNFQTLTKASSGASGIVEIGTRITTGDPCNLIFGLNCLGLITSGDDHIAIGVNVLTQVTNLTFDIGIGYNALEFTTGSRNLGIGGQNVGVTLTTGSDNTLVGSNTDVSAGATSNSSALGKGAIITASNQIKLGNDSVTEVITSGQLTLGVDKPGGTANIAGAVKLWSAGDNAFFSSFVTPTQTASAAYTLPTAPATVAGSMLVDAAANGMLSWTASPTVANLTDSALTPTYVPVAGTAGLLGNSNLSVDTSVTTCSVLNFGATTVDPTSINGDLWLNTATWKYQSGGTVKTLAVNQGVVDASTAAAGIVGECLTANVTAQALGGTGAAGNIVTLNLTAGDWIIEGSATLFGGTTGFTAASLVSLSLNTTTATQNTNTFMVSSDSIQALVASGYKGMRAPKMHLSVNATTPVYLVATASYVAGSPTAAAQVVATRIR